MEQYISIPTSDGFEIEGVLNSEEKSNTLIIFIHGLTGYMHEAHYVCGKDFFVSKGYEVFRFNFYGGGEKNRTLQESSIQTHGQDLDNIVSFFSLKYDKIILIAHSLGAPSILKMKEIPKPVSKIIYWDPAFDTQGVEKRFSRQGNKYIFTSGDGRFMEVSEDMVEQRKENHLNHLKNFSYPRESSYVIFAGGNTKTIFRPIISDLGIDFCIIDGANHGFTQEGKFEELFEKTLEFIES